MYKVIEYVPESPAELEKWLEAKAENQGLMLITVYKDYFVFVQAYIARLDIPAVALNTNMVN